MEHLFSVTMAAPPDEGTAKTFNASYDLTAFATVSALQTLKIALVKKSAKAPTTVVVNWAKRAQLQITGTSEEEFAGRLSAAIEERLQWCAQSPASCQLPGASAQ